MAGPVGAITGVVSTVGGIMQQGQQARIQAAQQRNAETAARVQGQIDALALRQQRDYSRMQLDMQDKQYAAQDAQMRLQLTEQTQKELLQQQSQTQLVESQMLDKLRQFQAAEYQIQEANRQLQSQALGEKAQIGEAAISAANQIEQALEKGDTQRAMLIAQQAAQGLIGSESASIRDSKAVEDMLAQAMQGGQQLDRRRLESDDQFDYTLAIGELQRRARAGDLNAARMAAQLQADAQLESLRYDSELTRQGGRMAQDSISNAALLRNQQGQINRTFNDAGFNIQATSMNTQNAARLAEIQAQGAMARASRPGILSQLGQLGGAISGLLPVSGGSIYRQQAPQQPVTVQPLAPFSGPVNDLGGAGFSGQTTVYGGFK